MFKDLKGKFNRAKVNHPKKTALGTFAACINSVGLITLPFDGGLTLFATTALTAAGSIAVTPELILDNIENGHKHSTYKDITHDDETYRMTSAQAEAYEQATKQIAFYQHKFDTARRDKQKRKFLKKAQALVNFQQDLINGAQTVKKGQSASIKFDLKPNKKPKK